MVRLCTFIGLEMSKSTILEKSLYLGWVLHLPLEDLLLIASFKTCNILSYRHLDHRQAVLVDWVEEGFTGMVLVVVEGMGEMVGMDITMAISLRVVPHMGMLICLVNLAVAVEIVA